MPRTGQGRAQRFRHKVLGWLLPALLCLAWGPSASAAALVIQYWETANGARVYFIPAMELPIVDVNIVFDAGSARDGDKPGVAQLTNALLDDGAGDLNADEIAQRLEGLGAELETDAQRDMAVVSLRSLSERKYLDPAIDTLALLLKDPTFPAAAFDRERSRQLVELRQEEQSPDDLATRTFYQAIYGKHPYASPPLGTPESLKALDRSDVQSHYRRYYVARNAVIALVGALDRTAAERLADRLAGQLPAGERPPALPPVQPLTADRTVHIEFPSAQMHIQMGQPGMSRGDPDYFPLYVGNFVLGGSGLVSRISEEIREKRGLSYSAYSYFIPMQAQGPYLLGLQTRTDQADKALTVLNDTVAGFIEGGPTKEELTAAKKNITGGFPLRLSSNRKIVQNLAMIGFYRLPLDYLDRFPERVQEVKADEIRNAFQRRVHPGQMVTVTVGTTQQ